MTTAMEPQLRYSRLAAHAHAAWLGGGNISYQPQQRVITQSGRSSAGAPQRQRSLRRGPAMLHTLARRGETVATACCASCSVVPSTTRGARSSGSGDGALRATGLTPLAEAALQQQLVSAAAARLRSTWPLDSQWQRRQLLLPRSTSGGRRGSGSSSHHLQLPGIARSARSPVGTRQRRRPLCAADQLRCTRSRGASKRRQQPAPQLRWHAVSLSRRPLKLQQGRRSARHRWLTLRVSMRTEAKPRQQLASAAAARLLSQPGPLAAQWRTAIAPVALDAHAQVGRRSCDSCPHQLQWQAASQSGRPPVVSGGATDHPRCTHSRGAARRQQWLVPVAAVCPQWLPPINQRRLRCSSGHKPITRCTLPGRGDAAAAAARVSGSSKPSVAKADHRTTCAHAADAHRVRRGGSGGGHLLQQRVPSPNHPLAQSLRYYPSRRSRPHSVAQRR